MSINPYDVRIHSFVDTMKQESDISHMRGPHKAEEIPPPATWQDKAWQYEDNYGNKANFIFAKHTTGQTRISTIEKYDLLPSPWNELLKAYTLNIVTEDVSAIYKRKKLSEARKFIIESNFFSTYAREEVVKYWERVGGNRNIILLNSFIEWLKINELIPPNIQNIAVKRVSSDGIEAMQKRQNKLPNEKAILAMGVIQHKAIPWDKTTWTDISPLDNQRDAFVCAMFALSMSSPNRAEAEQTILIAQPLKTMTEIVEGKKKKVHYLDWSGSKGFDDNKNHIIATMAPVISLIFDFLAIITAANRVLARYYKTPNSKLKDILQDFKVDEAKWKSVEPAPEQPINLFKLGYLLNLYDRSAVKVVRVTKTTAGAKRGIRSSYPYYSKQIMQLQFEDELIINSNQLGTLLALGSNNKKLLKSLDIQGVLSVTEVQNSWLNYLKKQFPLFPLVRNNTKEGFCDIEHRLFALNSTQLNLQGQKGGNDYRGSASPFSIISPSTMGKVFVNDLSGSGGYSKTIFERHGFSRAFRIAPHQMRHYLTDAADKGGLPLAVNNMWGGRKDPSQIVSYVHSSDDERAWTISEVLYNEYSKTLEEAKKSIRLIAKRDYENSIGEIDLASVTSSGICTQNLMVTPCQYLNDFNTQCVGCAKSCHIAHDAKTISLLRSDLLAQKKRLLAVQVRPQFHNSEAMQSWFKLHMLNTEKLKQLINLMTDPGVTQGSLIRILPNVAEFRIINLKTKKIEVRKIALPDPKAALIRLLKAKRKKNDDVINQLLEMF